MVVVVGDETAQRRCGQSARERRRYAHDTLPRQGHGEESGFGNGGRADVDRQCGSNSDLILTDGEHSTAENLRGGNLKSRFTTRPAGSERVVGRRSYVACSYSD